MAMSSLEQTTRDGIMNTEVELRDHVFVGPLRRSVNNARHIPGSIHDDATATKLGFRGGTVAGSIHLELFPRCC